jgi:hypothetical protein
VVLTATLKAEEQQQKVNDFIKGQGTAYSGQ